MCVVYCKWEDYFKTRWGDKVRIMPDFLRRISLKIKRSFRIRFELSGKICWLLWEEYFKTRWGEKSEMCQIFPNGTTILYFQIWICGLLWELVEEKWSWKKPASNYETHEMQGHKHKHKYKYKYRYKYRIANTITYTFKLHSNTYKYKYKYKYMKKQGYKWRGTGKI